MGNECFCEYKLQVYNFNIEEVEKITKIVIKNRSESILKISFSLLIDINQEMDIDRNNKEI